jgi:hypothetical protein
MLVTKAAIIISSSRVIMCCKLLLHCCQLHTHPASCSSHCISPRCSTAASSGTCMAHVQLRLLPPCCVSCTMLLYCYTAANAV